MNDDIFIGRQIHIVRTEKGIKQVELANLINKNQATYSNKEAGRRPFSVKELKVICNYLQINMEDLLNGKPVSNYDKNLNK